MNAETTDVKIVGQVKEKNTFAMIKWLQSFDGKIVIAKLCCRSYDDEVVMTKS